MPPLNGSSMARSTALYRNQPALKARLGELPARPGIYRFYDASGAIVYVGKSVSLRDRVRSYFAGRATTKKLRRIRQEVAAIDWEVTGSELEALLLESRLVKQYQPRFNVLLREFIPLPYVRVDLGDPYPRLEVTRQPARDGATYFGPFRSYAALDTAVDALTDALQLRTCSTAGKELVNGRSCYRYELGTCSAPCLELIPLSDYRTAVTNACGVFEGREEGALQALQGRMERAAERLQFELAARLRDAMRHIQAISGRQHALLAASQELSLVAACPSRTEEALGLFVFRHGRLVLQQEVPYAELRCSRACREWAERLLAAGAARERPAAARFDSALLDEIQIVTQWMKQKTRQGSYWQFPSGADPAVHTAELEAWLSGQLPAAHSAVHAA